MPGDFEIGRVIAVDTATLTIQLHDDLKALTRSTYEQTVEVGRINSYLILPVGAHKIVAMVTRMFLTEDAELRADRTAVVLPASRRIMKATMIGTLNAGEFSQGISLFPVIDNAVLLPSRDDLEGIFGTRTENQVPADAARPGFCISVGHSVVFPDFAVKINPDVFFGKHAAVIGSTGSGKSCTIATILQSVLTRPEVRQTRFVVLDTNGEYRAAFQKNGASGWSDYDPKYRCLYIPTDERQAKDRLAIPYWFMNSDDFLRLFRASENVQRPVLLEALRLARNDSPQLGPALRLREQIVHELNRIVSLVGRDEKTSRDVRDISNGLLKAMALPEFQAGWAELEQHLGLQLDVVSADIKKVMNEAAKHVEKATYPAFIPADARQVITGIVEPLLSKLTDAALGGSIPLCGVSADTPAFFKKTRLRSRHIEEVLRRDESGGARARDYSGTMLLRIDRLLADQRFDFLFGPVGQDWPDPQHSLATFLRDILGLPSGAETLSSDADVPDGLLPFYDRQRVGASSHNVVVVDLSLLASEVLENVTALIGRIILEFLQRLGDVETSGVERASFPVVLVLEEAQNYIREARRVGEDSISRDIFERIAREGRKYGLGLVIASQRPSELSKTVLSQCNSFVVHRLQNPEDLRYFREIVPGIFSDLLGQLPALAPRHALLLGEAVRAPALVYMREACPTPRSQDPALYRHWVTTDPSEPEVEAVSRKWEGKADGSSPKSG